MAGLAGAVILTRTLSGLVYGVGTLDPLTFIAVPALLRVVALLACLFPHAGPPRWIQSRPCGSR